MKKNIISMVCVAALLGAVSCNTKEQRITEDSVKNNQTVVSTGSEDSVLIRQTTSNGQPDGSTEGKQSTPPANAINSNNPSNSDNISNSEKTSASGSASSKHTNDEAQRASYSTTQAKRVGTGIKDSTGSYTGSNPRPTDLDTAKSSKNSSGSNLPGGY